MTRGQDFIKNAKCTHGHRSAMSISTWCDLHKKFTVLKLHDICHNPKCNCQKQKTFSPNKFQLEGEGFKNTMKKIFGISNSLEQIPKAGVENSYSYYFSRCCYEDKKPPISASN